MQLLVIRFLNLPTFFLKMFSNLTCTATRRAQAGTVTKASLISENSRQLPWFVRMEP